MNEKQTKLKHQEKHGVARMTMLERGNKSTMAPLVNSDLPNYVTVLTWGEGEATLHVNRAPY